MAVKKLTLSAPEEVIAETKRIAAKKKTSVSALFVRLFRTIDRECDPKDALGPIALSASGIVKLPADQTESELIEDALVEKYEMRVGAHVLVTRNPKLAVVAPAEVLWRPPHQAAENSAKRGPLISYNGTVCYHGGDVCVD